MVPYLAAVAGAVTALVGVQLSTNDVARPPTRFSVELQGVLARNPGPGLAFSPDGRALAYAAAHDGERVYVRSLDQLEAVPVRGSDGGQNLFWSPGSQWIGFQADGALQKVAAAGGSPVRLCDVAGLNSGASWGADDTIVFGDYNGERAPHLWRVSALGGIPEPVTILDAERGEMAHFWPQVLPGDAGVVFTVFHGFWSEARIAVQSWSDDAHRVILDGTSARYVPTGHLVFARQSAASDYRAPRGETLWAVPFDLGTLEVTGSPTPILENVLITGGDVAQFSVAGDGSLVYADAGFLVTEEGLSAATELVWVDRQGNAEELPLERARYKTPRVAPDGNRFAFVTSAEGEHIWIYDQRRGSRDRLTVEGSNRWPVWTHDGTRVAFASTRPGQGNLQLFEKSVDGSGAAVPLLGDSVPEGTLTAPISWSPQTSTLGFYMAEEATLDGDVWILPDGGTPVAVVTGPFDDASPGISPDGRWVAYVSDESGQPEVYVRPYPGPGPRVTISAGGGTEPVWSRDGGELFYRNGSAMTTVRIDVDGDRLTPAAPERLFDGPYALDPVTGRNPNYDVAPDGRFLMVRTVPGATDVDSVTVVLDWARELMERAPVD